MRTPTLIRNSMLAGGLIIALAAVPSTAVIAQEAGASMHHTSENRTLPGKAADAWITTKVKSEFATTKGIEATDISVTTVNGRVTLTGTVASAKEKLHAERVARHVKGVKAVDAIGLRVSNMTEK
ncbi:MAG: BON domain-containing protein [Rhodanobacter sp.]|nr:MAG: BON domain-containing protein [Rhodanobacter sp.]